MPAFRRIRAATRGLIAAPWTLASLSLFARRRQGSRCVIIAGRPPHCLENQAKTLDIVVSLIEGAKYGIRSNTICPGFVRTPLVEKQIPEQAIQLGITEEEVIKNVMLRATVDGEFTSLEDVANTALFLATFPTNALTGQSVVVAHGHFMQ